MHATTDEPTTPLLRATKKIADADEAVPFIAVGVVLVAVLFTLGSHLDWHWIHALHSHTYDLIAKEVCIWIFFTGMGIHISLGQIVQGGRVAGSSMVGGVIVPVALTYALTGNVYFAVAAMATDVAFSVGAFRAITKPDTLLLLFSVLMMLAIGDDVAGVITAASMFAKDVNLLYVGLYFVLIGAAFVAGKNWQVEHPLFWLFAAMVGTGLLALAHVHWTLGGCGLMIVAPEGTKHKINLVFRGLVPLSLLIFGTAAGAIDLRPSSGAWGTYTLLAFIGGHVGKMVGIPLIGYLGCLWDKRQRRKYPSDEDFKENHPFASLPKEQLLLLGVLAAANGTVAIYFLEMAYGGGFITSEMYLQGKVGFFLTIPAVYLEVAVMKLLGWFQEDDPNFVPAH